MSEFERFDALSFDCYGTLIDWETGIAEALRPWAEANDLAVADADLVAAHARHESRVQADRPTDPYPEILGETLRRIGHDLGAPVTGDDATRYGQSLADWPAFADSAESLARLAERFRLVIVSNVDRTSFRASNARLGVDFDLIVTAEDVGSYKPNVAHFERMFALLPELGVERTALCHVAESLFHDHEPAAALGLPSVWIHRRHAVGGFGATAEPRGDVEPDWWFTSLAELADAALEG